MTAPALGPFFWTVPVPACRLFSDDPEIMARSWPRPSQDSAANANRIRNHSASAALRPLGCEGESET
jgi:hypothetical protein